MLVLNFQVPMPQTLGNAFFIHNSATLTVTVLKEKMKKIALLAQDSCALMVNVFLPFRLATANGTATVMRPIVIVICRSFNVTMDFVSLENINAIVGRIVEINRMKVTAPG
ncbi:unnamed protein product [Allacma fusca]|uniref:Uncharacterized protein n=1 Tax=Allacma fusca TaxID=39272 RepID=A0A8J2KDA6_9HEXA|nr:unnamed protein product [Allacma fusca]